jgi:hypothetical protein
LQGWPMVTKSIRGVLAPWPSGGTGLP